MPTNAYVWTEAFFLLCLIHVSGVHTAGRKCVSLVQHCQDNTACRMCDQSFHLCRFSNVNGLVSCCQENRLDVIRAKMVSLGNFVTNVVSLTVFSVTKIRGSALNVHSVLRTAKIGCVTLKTDIVSHAKMVSSGKIAQRIALNVAIM